MQAPPCMIQLVDGVPAKACTDMDEELTTLHMLQRTGLSEMPARIAHAPGPNVSVSKVRHGESAQAVRLHPSWLAKQKQKEAFAKTVSAGSKTVFSNDGQPVASRPASAASAGTSGVPLIKHKQQGVQKQVLHPSWLAKKAAASRQAQLASSSAATKITFED